MRRLVFLIRCFLSARKKYYNGLRIENARARLVFIMKLAVIETGGKQYVVSADKKISVEKLPYEAGVAFTFDKVLLVSDGESVSLGKPYYDAKVSAELVEQVRAPKVITRKYHNKTRFRKKHGHRQHLSVVKILEIK